VNDFAHLESAPLTALRNQVMDRLTTLFSQDLITMEDYERRAADASRAETKSALVAVVEALPAAPAERTATVAAESRRGWRVSTEDAPQDDAAICIFGGTERRGVWKVPRNFDAICVFGGAKIDFTKAVLPAEGVTLQCIACFGGVDVVVPRGVRVDVRGNAILGGFDRPKYDSEDPNAPVIRVEGFAIFGGVSIKIKD